ncbi:MAG: spore maturation protein [Oscillospiraceae bacterium]
MSALADMAAALVIAGAALWGVLSGTDVFRPCWTGWRRASGRSCAFSLARSAADGGVYARASGALELLTNLLSRCWGFWASARNGAAHAAAARVRSGALAAATGSWRSTARIHIGRTAAVMLGSTETTFYVIAVYFGAAGIKHTRWAVPAALCADVVGFAASAFAVRLLWGGTL